MFVSNRSKHFAEIELMEVMKIVYYEPYSQEIEPRSYDSC